MEEQENSPVDLIISSLDPSIEINDLRRILVNLLKEYVMVIQHFKRFLMQLKVFYLMVVILDLKSQCNKTNRL